MPAVVEATWSSPPWNSSHEQEQPQRRVEQSNTTVGPKRQNESSTTPVISVAEKLRSRSTGNDDSSTGSVPETCVKDTFRCSRFFNNPNSDGSVPSSKGLLSSFSTVKEVKRPNSVGSGPEKVLLLRVKYTNWESSDSPEDGKVPLKKLFCKNSRSNFGTLSKKVFGMLPVMPFSWN